MTPNFHFNIDDVEPQFAADLAWIIGELEWRELEGGFWLIHFGDATSPFGGELVLTGELAALDAIRTGSRVRVKGSVQRSAVSFSMAGTLYDVESITPVVEGTARA